MAYACLSLRRLLHRSREALSHAERLELEAHLGRCARCAADVDVLVGIRAVVGQLPSRPLGPQRVERAIDRAFDGALGRAVGRAVDPAGETRAGETRAGEARAFEAAAVRTGARRRRGGRRGGSFAAAALVVAVSAATAALLWWPRPGHDPARDVPVADAPPASDRVIRGEVRAPRQTLASSAPIPSGVTLVSPAGAVLEVGPARVELSPLTRVAWDRAVHTLHLQIGRVDVAVEATPQRRFRVRTRAFTVEVIGTRFQVTPDGVTVSRGVVRVIEAGRGGATELRPGQSWRVAPPALPSPGRAPATPPPSAEAREAVKAAEALETVEAAEALEAVEAAEALEAVEAAEPVERTTTPPDTDTMRPSPAAAPPDVRIWLTRSRRALARADTDQAHAAARAALRASPSREQAAEARTVLAECAQAAGDLDRAMRLYLDIARRYRDLRAGETGLFAAARLAANRGHARDAGALFRRYLRIYPAGAFAGDARARLDALGDHDSP